MSESTYTVHPDERTQAIKTLKAKIGCGANTTSRQDDLLLLAYVQGRNDEKHEQALANDGGVF